MIKPAIVVVGYNRPTSVERLLNSIGNAEYDYSDIPLIISIDKSNLSNEVEKVARNFEWKHGTKKICRFPEKQGLCKHIIQCGDLSLKYGGVIILEDDLIVAKDFYTYTCHAHEKYGNDKRICGVSLYSYNCNVFTHFIFVPEPTLNDVFLGDMVVTWGQSWTDRQWMYFKKWYTEYECKLTDINVKIPRDISGWTRSWGRYFANYMSDMQLSYIYPYIARTTCFSDFGEHNKANIPLTFVQVPLMSICPNEYRMPEYEKLLHYDSFFERVLNEKQNIVGIPGNEICMDISNMKTSTDKKYIVTNSEISSCKRIASFGLTRRPIELNVIDEIPGNELNLYELNSSGIRPWKGRGYWYRYNHRRMKYEYSDASWRLLLKYAPMEFFDRLKEEKDKICRFIRKNIMR